MSLPNHTSSRKPFSKFPSYTVAYVLLVSGFKAFQLMAVLSEREVAVNFYGSLPLLFTQDAVIMLALYIFLDVGMFWMIQKSYGWIKILLHLLANAIFASIILYTCLSLKFYYLFGTLASYGVLIQADHVISFKEGFFREMDAYFWWLMLAGAFIFIVTAGMTLWVHKQHGVRLPANPPPGLSEKNTFMQKSLLFLKSKSPGFISLLYLLLAIPLSKNMLAGINFYALDKNPIYELMVTTALGQGWIPPAQPSLVKDTEMVSAESVLIPQSHGQKITLNPTANVAMSDLNVVLVKMESATRNYVGYYNPEFKPFTPNLDKLIASSLILDNHYCQEPASLKSLYSIITGKFPYKTRNWKEFVEKAKNDVSLPEILRQHGYHTAFLTSSDGRIYSQNTLLKNRFDEMVDMNGIAIRGWNYKKYPICYDDKVLIRLFDDTLSKHTQKFFVLLAPHFPHHPYNLADPKLVRVNAASKFDHYKNSLFYSDYILGEILAVLRKHQLEDKTLFVVVSDHGEAFYQHPRNYIHSIYVYEENVRTYCVFHNPRLLAPGRYSGITQHIDIMPTILEMLNCRYSKSDGTSLMSTRGETCALFYTSFNDLYLGLRDGPMKYILNRRYNSEELYNLDEDPEEKNNLAPSQPELCQKFKTKLLALEKYIQ